MKIFNYLDLLEITKEETLLKSLFSQKEKDTVYSPKKETITNLLNYSKALSIRKSTIINNNIEMILN